MLLTKSLSSFRRFLRLMALRLLRSFLNLREFRKSKLSHFRRASDLQDQSKPQESLRSSVSIEALIHQDIGTPDKDSYKDTYKDKENVVVKDNSADTVTAKKGSAARPEFQHQPDYPRHVAIIMDGNNRWARQRSGIAVSGHRAGVETIRGVLRGCEQYGVEVLTLFAFSSENWARPEAEVGELMRLFRDYLDREVRELHEKNVRLRFIGRRDRLEPDLVERMNWAETLTAENDSKTLVLAVDYGGRWDIVEACQQLCSDLVAQSSSEPRAISEEAIRSQIDEDSIGRYLSLSNLPEPDLCIRTGGEVRVSNFMLWQFSYAEFYFTNCYWPDFTEQEFAHALEAYAGRQRRFGRTGEQVNAKKGAQGLTRQRHA